MDDNKKVIQCKTSPFTYTLVIKQVKNINMRISHKGDLIVSANSCIPLDAIDSFVSSKASWIIKHQNLKRMQSTKTVLNDTHITLFGNILKIKKIQAKVNQISYDKTTLYVHRKPNVDVCKLIQKFLDKLCKDVFNDIAMLTYQSLNDYQLDFPEVKIRTMKSRWGSCTPVKKSITLNRKLIHYPFEFIEYVILHEFVHFIQPNHSKSFYNIIENHMPDYKVRLSLVS